VEKIKQEGCRGEGGAEERWDGVHGVSRVSGDADERRICSVGAR
jgi:hypothetical protein